MPAASRPRPPGPVDATGPANWAHPLNTRASLLAWWLMAPAAGLGRVPDLTGRGNHGTFGGSAAGSPGPPGWPPVLTLNGSNAYAECPTSSAFDEQNDCTLAFWLVWDGSAGGVVWSRTQAGAWAAGGKQIEVPAGGAWYFNEFLGSTVNSGHTLVADRWTHLCVVKATANLTFYADGVQTGTGTAALNGPVSGADVVRLGQKGNTGYLPGRLGEWRYYNRLLGAGEVAGLYRQAFLGHPDTLRRRAAPADPSAPAADLGWASAAANLFLPA